jgi:tetratricopeptide (TPR) repeat protein
VDLLGETAQAQARIGAPEDANATLDLALQAISDIKDNAVGKAAVSRSLALSAVAATQRKVGLASQAEVTFQRAAQAASEIANPVDHAMALTRLARARYDDGHAPAGMGTFNEAVGLAAALEKPGERARGLLNVAEAEVRLGLEASPVLDEALAATRAIPEQTARVSLLNRIARAQVDTGRLQDGLSTYSEALDALEATDNPMQRRSSMFMIIRAWPGQPQDTRLVAASAPRLLRIIDSTAEKQTAAALIMIAKAMPQ